jgi:hypothetical protein
VLGWLNVALVQGTSGRWHDAHDAPKWFAGGLWHETHAVDDGCEAAQETPGFLWHDAHATVRTCAEGGLWHDAHAEEVWRNDPCLNGTPTLWHAEHEIVRLWAAGAVWHDAHGRAPVGCVKVQSTPGFRWQLAHAPGWLCPADGVWQLEHAADECL